MYKSFFLHTDIVIMIVLFIALTLFTLVQPLSWSYAAGFAGGLVVFMFSEYLTHRFFFHLRAPKNAVFLKFLKRIHYDHHTDPDDLKLLFLPVWYSLPNFLLLAAIFYWVAGALTETAAFSAGLIFMLLVYEWKHFVAHRPLKPKTKFGKWIKKTHLLHHYKNENYWYGVSTPFVDALFGTLKDEKSVPTSDTAKDLERRGERYRDHNGTLNA